MTGTNANSSGQSCTTTRRGLLCATGAGIGLLLGSPLSGDEQQPAASRILKSGDRVTINGRANEILQAAYDLGCQYERKHGGCARCTVAALQDAVPFIAVDESLFRGSTCLDGGATPTGTQNCGAFTGAGMVIGYVCGSTRRERFEGSAALAHQLLHQVYHRFREEYGTVLCEDDTFCANELTTYCLADQPCPAATITAARGTASGRTWTACRAGRA
jgi:hypothetical protein